MLALNGIIRPRSGDPGSCQGRSVVCAPCGQRATELNLLSAMPPDTASLRCGYYAESQPNAESTNVAATHLGFQTVGKLLLALPEVFNRL